MKESLKKEFKAFITNKVTIASLVGVCAIIGVIAYTMTLPNYDKTKYDEWYPNGYIVFNDDIAEPIYSEYTPEENMRHNIVEYIYNKAIYDMYDIYSDNEELILYNLTFGDEHCYKYNIASLNADTEDDKYGDTLLFLQITEYNNRYIVKINNNDANNKIDDYYYIDVKNKRDNEYTLNITKIDNESDKHTELFDSLFTNVDDYSNKIYNEYKEKGIEYLDIEGTDEKSEVTLDYIRKMLFY